MRTPECLFCGEQAAAVAAQSSDAGATVDWVLVCSSHADGWNNGGDWEAPVYPILFESNKTTGNLNNRKRKPRLRRR